MEERHDKVRGGASVRARVCVSGSTLAVPLRGAGGREGAGSVHVHMCVCVLLRDYRTPATTTPSPPRRSQQGRAATDVHSLLQSITIVNRCLRPVRAHFFFSACVWERETDASQAPGINSSVNVCAWVCLHGPRAHNNVQRAVLEAAAAAAAASEIQLLFQRHSKSRQFAFTG